MLKRHEVEVLLKAGHKKSEVAHEWGLVALSETHRALKYSGWVRIRLVQDERVEP